MAVSANNGRLLFLVARRSDLEYRMTTLMMRIQKLAIDNAEILNNKNEESQQYYQSLDAQIALMGEGSEDATGEVSPTNSLQFDSTKFDAQLAQLATAQKMLDLEQKKLDTQHQAVVAEEESVQKLVDKCIKEEFTYGSASSK